MDEADKLISYEFHDDIKYFELILSYPINLKKKYFFNSSFIYSNLPENKQMIVLSATYPVYLANYLTRYMRSPTYVRLNIVDPSLRGIKQYYKIVQSNFTTPNERNSYCENKLDELIKLFSLIQFTQCIVYTNYQFK